MFTSTLSLFLVACASIAAARPGDVMPFKSNTSPSKYQILSASIGQTRYAVELFKVNFIDLNNDLEAECSLNWSASLADEDRGEPIYIDFECPTPSVNVSMSRLDTDMEKGFELFIQTQGDAEADWIVKNLSTVGGWKQSSSTAGEDPAPSSIVNQWTYAGGAIVSS